MTLPLLVTDKAGYKEKHPSGVKYPIGKPTTMGLQGAITALNSLKRVILVSAFGKANRQWPPNQGSKHVLIKCVACSVSDFAGRLLVQ